MRTLPFVGAVLAALPAALFAPLSATAQPAPSRPLLAWGGVGGSAVATAETVQFNRSARAAFVKMQPSGVGGGLMVVAGEQSHTHTVGRVHADGTLRHGALLVTFASRIGEEMIGAFAAGVGLADTSPTSLCEGTTSSCHARGVFFPLRYEVHVRASSQVSAGLFVEGSGFGPAGTTFGVGAHVNVGRFGVR